MAEHYENKVETIEETAKKADVSTALKWVDKAAGIFKKHGLLGILKGLLLIILTFAVISIGVIFVKVASNPDKVFQQYYEWQLKKEKIEDDRHKELIEKRMANTPKIQSECDKLLYKTGAQRVLFMELHNNTNNIAGLPFYYADASCESMNEESYPIAPYCQQAKLSLMPFASLLFEKTEWCGSLDELKTIDKGFYHKMKSSGADHMAAVIVYGSDHAVGMLFVTFGEGDVHECENVLSLAKSAGAKIGVLVEVENEINSQKNNRTHYN
jgi:hypothetical protein